MNYLNNITKRRALVYDKKKQAKVWVIQLEGTKDEQWVGSALERFKNPKFFNI